MVARISLSCTLFLHAKLTQSHTDLARDLRLSVTLLLVNKHKMFMWLFGLLLTKRHSITNTLAVGFRRSNPLEKCRGSLEEFRRRWLKTISLFSLDQVLIAQTAGKERDRLEKRRKREDTKKKIDVDFFVGFFFVVEQGVVGGCVF